MTKLEAHELLNAARAGLPVSRHSITAALMVTGDLMPSRPVSSPWLPSQDPTEYIPVWQPGNMRLLEAA